jgi:hypothetical protein
MRIPERCIWIMMCYTTYDGYGRKMRDLFPRTLESSNTYDAVVFVYTGEGGAKVPDDVVRVRIDSSVTSIPAKAFYNRKKLAEVELCEGVVEIGERSFGFCDHSITKFNLPNSVRRICGYAFTFSLRCPIRLHDGIESIERSAFVGCIFTNFRVPTPITVIPFGMLHSCKSMFSLELPEVVTRINDGAFYNCYCLRNVAFPPMLSLVIKYFFILTKIC